MQQIILLCVQRFSFALLYNNTHVSSRIGWDRISSTVFDYSSLKLILICSHVKCLTLERSIKSSSEKLSLRLDIFEWGLWWPLFSWASFWGFGELCKCHPNCMYSYTPTRWWSCLWAGAVEIQPTQMSTCCNTMMQMKSSKIGSHYLLWLYTLPCNYSEIYGVVALANKEKRFLLSCPESSWCIKPFRMRCVPD